MIPATARAIPIMTIPVVPMLVTAVVNCASTSVNIAAIFFSFLDMICLETPRRGFFQFSDEILMMRTNVAIK